MRAQRKALRCGGALRARGFDGAQGVVYAREREAHHVEVAAFDTGDEFSAEALDAVGAGFVERLAGGDVVCDFLVRERREVDVRGGDLHGGNFGWAGDDGESGEHVMRAAGEEREHARGVSGIGGLAENFGAGFRVNDDGGVCGEDHGFLARAAEMRGGGFGFCGGDPLHVSGGGFVRVVGFVNVGDEGGEGDAGVAQDFRAPGGGGGEDDIEHERKSTAQEREGERPFGKLEAEAFDLSVTMLVASSNHDGFLVLAEGAAEGVGNFADGDVGLDGGENGGHEIFAGAGAALDFGGGSGGFRGVAAGAHGLEARHLGAFDFRIDAHRGDGFFFFGLEFIHADDDLRAGIDGLLIFVGGFLDFFLHVSRFDGFEHAAHRVDLFDVVRARRLRFRR